MSFGRLSFLCSCAAMLALPATARAEQLRCATAAQVDAAIAKLPSNSAVIHYDTLSASRARVVVVQRVRRVSGCGEQLELSGAVRARSARVIAIGGYGDGVTFDAVDDALRERVDISHLYVQTQARQWTWLPALLDIEVQAGLTQLSMSQGDYARLPEHDLVGAMSAGRRISMGDLGLRVFGSKLLRRAVDHYDAGNVAAAKKSAERAVKKLLSKAVGGGRRQVRVRSDQLDTVRKGLQERLARPYDPLGNIFAGYALRSIETLPSAKLEETVATLAVWSMVSGMHEDASFSRAARALLMDGRTQRGLARRAPRAAALTRFYAALYHLAMRAPGQRDGEQMKIIARVEEYFRVHRKSFKSDYAAALRTLMDES